MGKKRSKGVSFWGWTFIISGIGGALGIINPHQAIIFSGVGLFLVGIALSAAKLIAGIFILKLNEAARKAAVLFAVISIMLIPLSFKPIFNSLHDEEYYVKKRQYIIEKVKPEYQEKALLTLDAFNETRGKISPALMMVLLGAPVFVFNLCPIIFFTRRRVKEQFR
ncbi:hypothetical protein EPN16_00535 [bacterium]|nr:MAG: hypothetical protein EPN16_00535 [bacterium]